MTAISNFVLAFATLAFMATSRLPQVVPTRVMPQNRVGHETMHERADSICFCVQCEVFCVEYVYLGVWYIPAVAFSLTEVKREVVLTPEQQNPGLRVL